MSFWRDYPNRKDWRDPRFGGRRRGYDPRASYRCRSNRLACVRRREAAAKDLEKETNHAE